MTTLITDPVDSDPGSGSAGGKDSPRAPWRVRERGWRSTWLVRHDGVLAILVYLVISLFFYRSVVAHPVTNCACGVTQDPGDNADFVWWFQWFVQALGHGQPLLHPTVIWSPTGIDLAGTTAPLLLGLLASPLTLLWGPIFAYNVLMILAPAVSAWAANRLCRQITAAPGPSLLAGATFGFSTYEIAHLVGHLSLVVMVCPPLVALCVIRLFDGTLTARRFVIYLSLLLTAQIFLSVEVAFTMTIVGTLALAAFWATGTPEQRREIIGRVPVIVLPWAIAGLVSSWYTIQVLGAPAYAVGAGSEYPTDALSLFIPMPYTWLGGASLAGLSARFPSGWNETNAYLGLPLILIIGRYLITRRRTRVAKALGILIALITLWILGPILYVDGRPSLHMPYQLLASLPLFNETMQGRIAVYLALVAAVILAVWLASPRRSRLLGWACALVALMAVLPNLASPSVQSIGAWTNPAFFRTGMYRHYIRRGQSVLPILWGPTGESFMWQAEDHMYWNMANGYWIFEPMAGWSSQVTADLWIDARPHSDDGPLLKQLISERHVSDVILQDAATGPYNPSKWRLVLSSAGLHPTAKVGGVTLYHVPASWWTSRTSR